jgi:hypothetical protein
MFSIGIDFYETYFYGAQNICYIFQQIVRSVKIYIKQYQKWLEMLPLPNLKHISVNRMQTELFSKIYSHSIVNSFFRFVTFYFAANENQYNIQQMYSRISNYTIIIEKHFDRLSKLHFFF